MGVIRIHLKRQVRRYRCFSCTSTLSTLKEVKHTGRIVQGIDCSRSAGLDPLIRASLNASNSSLTTIANPSGEFFLVQSTPLSTFTYNRNPNPTYPPGLEHHPHLPFGPSPSPLPTLRPPRPSHPPFGPPALRSGGPTVTK